MKRVWKWLALVLAVLFLTAIIGRAIVHRQEMRDALAQSTATARADAFRLSADDVYKVQSQDLQHTIAVSGTLTAQRSALVKAKVSGELVKLDVREGESVRAGAIVGQIEQQEYTMRLKQAAQQAAAAKAQWQIAQQNLENNQELVKQGFISRNALDTSQSNAASSRANYEAALAAQDLAQKALRDTAIIAPIDGQISQRFVQAGERLSIDTRVVEVVDLGSLELVAPLTPQDVTQVQIGTPGTLRVDGLDEPIAARIVRINPSAAADTRAVVVYLSVAQHPALRHGLFAQGQILLDERQALAVPASAISRHDGQDQVLAIREGKLVRRPVTLGVRTRVGANASTALVEVTQGLAAGELILRDAGGTLHEGQAVVVTNAAR